MKAPEPATLTFLSGPRDGDSVPLAPGAAGAEAVIGRAAGCALVLADDPDVSRRHARLSWEDGAWLLEDLDSQNGTFVGEFADSRRIAAPFRLPPGALFRVGNTRLRLETGGAGAPEARVKEAARPARG